MGFKLCDSNVLIAANGKVTHADNECQLACIEALEALIDCDVLVLDTTDEIFNEYMKYLSFSGQPGVGDMVFKYIQENKYNTSACLLVTITKIAHGSYSEVPNEIDNAGFDKSDQKFVAAAISSGVNPAILNATDSDWFIYKKVLDKHSIHVLQICPQHQNK